MISTIIARSANKRRASQMMARHRHVVITTPHRIGCKRPHGQIGSLFHAAPFSTQDESSPSQRFQAAFDKMRNRQGFASLKLRNQPPSQSQSPQSSSSESNQPSNRPMPRKERQDILHELSQEIVLLFSDFNLRNNEHTRSQFYESQYLPLNELVQMGVIKRYTRDANEDPTSLVLDAIEISRKDGDAMQLTVEEYNGQLAVKRTPPFDYIDNIKTTHKRMMIIEGCPILPRKRLSRAWNRSQSHVRSLLRQHNGGSEDIPMSYWRFHPNFGMVNVEFETEEGAKAAWGNLDRAVLEGGDVSGSKPHHVAVSNLLPDDEDSESYILQVGDFSLIARSIELPMSDEMSPEVQAIEPDVNVEPSHIAADDTKAQLQSTVGETYTRQRKWEVKGAVGLRDFTNIMSQLYQEHLSLPPPSKEWIQSDQKRRRKVSEEPDEEYQQQLQIQRRDLFNDVERLISSVQASIREGSIRALKDSHKLSDALGKAMLIYSETSVTDNSEGDDSETETSGAVISPYEACLLILDILRSLNLDIHPSHYSYAIRAACHESKWEEASEVFLRQINGDDNMATGGFVPIDPTLGWNQPLEMGLYAVARDSLAKLTVAEENGRSIDISPSQRVFDTAMKMCMISPSGKENYILAAGIALGRAGLATDCLNLATDPKSISTYGPSIAPAAMLACIECSRNYQAIEAYQFFMLENQGQSEWQWGGGDVTAVKPLCRDLAIQAVGNIKRGGFSKAAMDTFKEVMHEDCPISTNALNGLAQSLEYDRDWSSSIKLLKAVMDSVHVDGNTSWRILTDELELGKMDGTDVESTLTQLERDELLSNILSSAMRACNNDGQYGLGILLCSIVDAFYADKKGGGYDESIGIVKAVASQQIVRKSEKVMTAYIQSLNGLGCISIADELMVELQHDSTIFIPRRRKGVGLEQPESWLSAFVAIGRVLQAIEGIHSKSSHISPETRLLFERGLSRAMEHCIDSSQAAAALYLFKHSINILEERDPTMREKVRTFFGMDESYGASKSENLFQNDEAINVRELSLSDPLLAAIMKASHKIGKPEEAVSIFNDGTRHLDDATIMIQSTNAALEAGLELSTDKLDPDEYAGLSFFDQMDERVINPSTFLIVARHYAKNNLWHEIGEVYNKARRAGCITEDLGMITMQAVCESELLDGKIIVLRRIVDDICRVIGVESNGWIKSRYWGIKRHVGFHYARLLMRWNDPASSQKEELVFAVNEMHQCSREGITTKNDPLMAIVKISKVYNIDEKMEEGTLSEKQRKSAVNLILEAWGEAKRSGFAKNQYFTAEVARGLRSLKANNECIAIVKSLLSESDGKKKHGIAIEEAIYAASKERDGDSFSFFMDEFERLGYDPSRLSI